MSEVLVIKPTIETKKTINETNINNIKKKVCAYCRVSTDFEDQRTSYYSQINHYTDMIKKNKNWVFAGIYADDGITGTQIKNRLEFIRMIEDCQDGKIDIIIAKSISRFARNTVDTLNTVRMLRDLNVDVFFEKENIHTLQMDSEMFLTLYSAFAQAESESTSQNVKMGYRAKMKRGEACGKIACYGYIWDKTNKKIIINEREAKVIRKIFNYYINGMGSSLITKQLNNDHVPTAMGKGIWHSGVIKSILKNEKYVGDLCGQKTFVVSPISHKSEKNRGQLPKYYVKEHHPAIINRSVWDKTREIYNSRSIKIKEGKEYCDKYSLRYTFSSIIFCGNCNQTYTRRVSPYVNHDGVKHNHIYWYCSSSNSAKKHICHNNVTIRDEELKSLFCALYNKMIIEYKNNNLIFDKIKQKLFSETNEEKIQKIDKQIEDVKLKISKLIDLNLNNEIDYDVFSDKNGKYTKELQELELLRNNTLKCKDNDLLEKRKLNRIENAIAKSSTMYQFDDEIFKQIVRKIVIGGYNNEKVYNPNIVKFYLNINNNYKNDNNNFLCLGYNEGLY